MICVQVSAGRGPEECDLAVHHIGSKMHAMGPSSVVIRTDDHSCILGFDGPEAEQFVRSWEGTILWVCKNPLNRPGRERKNWYVGVRQIELPHETTIEIRDEDISIETMRASGKGGQHVNKTSTKVRVTHGPSGIVVICEQERSQKQNLKKAKTLLVQKLKEQRESHLAALDASNWANHNTLERGNPVRTFYGPRFTETP